MTMLCLSVSDHKEADQNEYGEDVNDDDNPDGQRQRDFR